jgi:hypothetical protein
MSDPSISFHVREVIDRDVRPGSGFMVGMSSLRRVRTRRCSAAGSIRSIRVWQAHWKRWNGRFTNSTPVPSSSTTVNWISASSSRERFHYQRSFRCDACALSTQWKARRAMAMLPPAVASRAIPRPRPLCIETPTPRSWASQIDRRGLEQLFAASCRSTWTRVVASEQAPDAQRGRQQRRRRSCPSFDLEPVRIHSLNPHAASAK